MSNLVIFTADTISMGESYKINGRAAPKQEFEILKEFLEENGAPQSVFRDRVLTKAEILRYVKPTAGPGLSYAACVARFGVLNDILMKSGFGSKALDPCEYKVKTEVTMAPEIFLPDILSDELPGQPVENQEFFSNGKRYKFYHQRLYVQKDDGYGWKEVDLTPFYDGTDEMSFEPERIVYDAKWDRFFVMGKVWDDRMLLCYDPKTNSANFVTRLDERCHLTPGLKIAEDGKELHMIFKSGHTQRISLEKFDGYANTDGWEFIEAPADRLYSVAACPKNSDVVFMYGDAGIYVSHDAGKSWTQTSISNQVRDIEFDPKDPNKIHALVGYGSSSHMVSTDGGLTWTEQHVFKGRTATSMVFDKKDPGVIYFGFHDSDHETPSGIVRYENGEYNFLPFGHNLTGLISWDIGQDDSGKLHLVPEIYDHPKNLDGQYQPPYLTSTDGGKTWKVDRSGGGINWHVSSFSFDEKSGELYTQEEGGSLLVTGDRGKSWGIANRTHSFDERILFDDDTDDMIRCRTFSFAGPAVGGIYTRPRSGGAWDLEGSLGFRSIVSIAQGSDYTYALERGRRTVGIWRRKR